ncbi:MAG TPA: hypothetical protein VNP72_02170 [Longimicrobium sp.]|nr:hypothetical protein [Longimicrobium sp.]
MAKTVLGGTVYRTGQAASLAAGVDHIDWPAVASAATVPTGATGTLYLHNPPPQIGHYDANDQLSYQDSNHHNDSLFLVTANHGPTKYGVRKL